MKLFLSFLICLFTVSQGHSYLRFLFNDAGNLVRGTMDPLRNDHSSTTELGPRPDARFIGNLHERSGFNVTIGSANSLITRSDIRGDDTAVLTEALTRLGALGNTLNGDNPGNIFFNDGVYEMTLATIPTGVTVYAAPGSSVIFVPADNINTMLTVYGRLENITIDVGNRPYDGELIQVQSNATVDVTITGAGNMRGDSPDVTPFMIRNSTNFSLTAHFESFVFANQDSAKGGLATIIASTDGLVFITTDDNGTVGVGDQGVFSIQNRNVVIDGIYRGVQQRGITDRGGSRELYIRGKHILNGTPTSTGYIELSGAFSVGPSSGIFITVELIGNTDNIAEYIGQSNTTNGTFDVWINNCILHHDIGAKGTFVEIQSGAERWVISDNYLLNATLISDSGTDTVTNDNYIEGAAQ